MVRAFKWVLTLLLWLAIAAAIAAWIYGRQVLPQASGTLKLPGLHAEVRIERDVHGIPTLHASDLHDAMFALGVVHAQDRLWQMETHRRIAGGRLAEAFGPKAVDTDRFLRTLGLARTAEKQWAHVQLKAPESARALSGYAAGVNAMLGALKARPPEMLMLGIKPEPWKPADSIGWTLVMSVDLSFNWASELLRLRLAPKLPKARIDELLPPYQGQPVPESADYAALYRDLGLGQARQHAAADGNQALLARLQALAPQAEVDGLGSNAWVVAGSHTSTGKPLLANDPHLKLSTPGLWYLVRIKTPQLDIAGASMPGVPAVLIGQNAHIAWGFTNGGPDVQDTYLERIHPDDPSRYQTPDGWASFEAHEESILVRGEAPRSVKLRATRHGPVISDAAASGAEPELLQGRDGTRYALALRFTALDSEADPVGTGLGIVRATSVDAFIAAASTWVAPMQNMIVADREGRIAMVHPARIPLRGPANDFAGLAPAPGWLAAYDWQGWLPVEQLPQVRDPESGFIANANQKITPEGYPHFLGHHWALPYRHQRIEQLLQARPQHDMASLRDIQADVLSLAARPLLPALRAVQSKHRLAAAAKAQLQGFEGRMEADAAAPLIFWVWQRQLSKRVLADEVGEAIYDRMLGMRGYFDGLEGVITRQDAWWCDDKATAAPESCPDIAQAAFDAALDEIVQLQGEDPAQWRWGRSHQLRAEHRPFSNVGWLAPYFELRAPSAGDTYTVNVSRVGLRPDAATGAYYLNEHGPGFRGLYDLADRQRSMVIHSTGQSGIPWSPHFKNFLAPWLAVQGVPLFVPQGEAPQAVLTLKP